jgi:hypothetical protein
MTENIFLIPDDGPAVPLRQTPYESEDLLQALLERAPDVLSGLSHAEGPRRWVLVRREQGVPDGLLKSDVWSLDHLFLDQDGIPTLVEVKRATDTRIRREVVAQMLDYAANAVAYWSLEKIQSSFAATQAAGNPGLDTDEILAEALGIDDVEEFWRRVETNLRAGRIRLVFVADEIPPSLRRIIEFLNEQMRLTEVVGIEVRQFLGGGVRTLVPSIVGRTAKAEAAKRSTPNGPLPSVDEWFDQLRQVDPRLPDVARSCASMMEQVADGIEVTSTGAGLIARVEDYSGKARYPFSLYKDGTFYLGLKWLKAHPPFSDPELRRQTVAELTSVPGLVVPGTNPDGHPGFDLIELLKPGTLEGLRGVLAAMVTKLRTPPEAPAGDAISG